MITQQKLEKERAVRLAALQVIKALENCPDGTAQKVLPRLEIFIKEVSGVQRLETFLADPEPCHIAMPVLKETTDADVTVLDKRMQAAMDDFNALAGAPNKPKKAKLSDGATVDPQSIISSVMNPGPQKPPQYFGGMIQQAGTVFATAPEFIKVVKAKESKRLQNENNANERLLENATKFVASNQKLAVVRGIIEAADFNVPAFRWKEWLGLLITQANHGSDSSISDEKLKNFRQMKKLKAAELQVAAKALYKDMYMS